MTADASGDAVVTAAEATTLLAVAADTIAAVLSTGMRHALDVSTCDGRLGDPRATFVTLERGEQLLGCIGSLEPVRPLAADVAHNAVAAAFDDPRLPPVGGDDFVVMSIEISVLDVLEPVAVRSHEELAASLRPGTDGLVVEAPGGRATFLPAVWRHFGDDADAFLGALWRKAGLAPGTWRPGTQCTRYTAQQLVDPGPRPAPSAVPARHVDAAPTGTVRPLR